MLHPFRSPSLGTLAPSPAAASRRASVSGLKHSWAPPRPPRVKLTWGPQTPPSLAPTHLLAGTPTPPRVGGHEERCPVGRPARAQESHGLTRARSRDQTREGAFSFALLPCGGAAGSALLWLCSGFCASGSPRDSPRGTASALPLRALSHSARGRSSGAFSAHTPADDHLGLCPQRICHSPTLRGGV